MRSFILGVLLAALSGSACDCKGNGGDLDPSDVRPADLYGWWTATNPDGSVTVFGFVPREEAAGVLPLQPEEATADILAVYEGPHGSLGEPIQLATFEVKDGELLQTVLRDASAAPGTQLRTRILALSPQRELKLQSSHASRGSRSFAWAARCPSAGPNGVFDVAGQACPNSFSSATSLAVDAQGTVHAASGIAGRVDFCPNGRAPQATYSRFANACEPALNPLPDFRESAMAVDGSTLHFAYVTLSANDASRDHLLFYRYRSLGPRGDWTEEPVAGQGYPVHELRLVLRDGQPLLVVSRNNGVIELYRREAGAWSLVPTLLTNETPLAGLMADATLDREGRLVLLLESSHQLAYERAGGFELLPLPQGGMAVGFGGGVAVDASGRIHTAYVYDEIGDNADGTGGRVVSGRGLYALYDGTAWTSYELGPATYPRIVTQGDGPWRVVHGLTKAQRTTLALTEVSPDGSLRSELINFERTSGGTSPEPFYHPMAAGGPDGTIAAAWDGNRVYIRPPEAQLVRERTTLTFSFEGRGGGRVRSADGTIDCTATCTVEVPVGSRHQLFFEADAQSVFQQGPCPSNYLSLYDSCWYDVFPDPQSPIVIRFRETPVASVVPVAAPDGTSTLTRIGARGERLVIAASTTNGRLPVGADVVDVGSARDALAVREADGQVWGSPLPATPVAVGLRADGSASALFFANSAMTFPSGTVGSESAPALILAHYAGGSFQGLERLADVPSGTTLLAGAVGDDDAAAAVISNTDGFGSMGFAQWNLLVYRDATGAVVLRGLEAGAAAGGSAGLTLGNGRAVVSLPHPFNDATLSQLSLFDGGALVGTQTVKGSTLVALALGADRLLSVWSPSEANLDFGGGYVPSNGQAYFSAEHGLDGRLLSAAALTGVPLTAGHFGITSAQSGTIFARTSYGFGLEYGRLGDPGYFFTFGGDLLGNKATPLTSDSGGSSFWVAVRHQGTVDYDITRVENTYRTLLLQMRLP